MKVRSRRDVFSRLSLRIAALFGGIAILLLVAAGIVIYATATADLHNAIDVRVPNEHLERQLVAQAIDRIRYRIIIIDGAVILCVGLLGIWYSLRPHATPSATTTPRKSVSSPTPRTSCAHTTRDHEDGLRSDPVG